MFKSLLNDKRVNHVSRKSVKNSVISPKTGNIDSIEQYSKAKSGGKQKLAGVGKTIVLSNNVPRYRDEDDFNIKITQAHNNERNLISTLDNINLKIIEELLNNGDIKSSEIATKLAIPLSTIQRRRSMLEKYSVLEKTYTLDPKKLGLRISEISINTKKGNSHEVMKEIYKSHRRNIVDMSLRIGNPDTNISFRIVYKNSVFLCNLLEEIKENEMVNGVSWSEYISEKKNDRSSFVDLFSS